MAEPTYSPFLTENFLKQLARHLKPNPAKTIGPSASLTDLVVELATQKIGCLVVMEGEECVGIVSERDVLRAVSQAPVEWANSSVDSIMTRDVEIIPRHGSLARILYLMDIRNIRHLVVRKSGEKALSVLSIKDVIDFLYERLGRAIPMSLLKEIGDPRVLELFFSSPIGELKPLAPVFVDGDLLIRQAVRILVERDIGSVLVKGEGGRLVGIFTERDLMRMLAAYGSDALDDPIHKTMTTSPHTTLATSTVAMAFNLFSSRGFRHLPVIDQQENLVGVLSAKNFLNVLSRNVMKELQR